MFSDEEIQSDTINKVNNFERINIDQIDRVKHESVIINSQPLAPASRNRIQPLANPLLQQAFNDKHNVLSSSMAASSSRFMPSSPTSFSQVLGDTVPMVATIPSQTKTMVDLQLNTHPSKLACLDKNHKTKPN